MATFYIGFVGGDGDGPPVLRGRSTTEAKNPYKGNVVGTYSYWQLYITEHVLDGAPDNNHVLGTGYSPGDVLLERMYLGLNTANSYPLNAPGHTDDKRLMYNALDGARFRPWEYKGLDVSRILFGGGHIFDPSGGLENLFEWSEWSNNFYHGLDIDKALRTPGHKIRPIGDPSAPATFGYFDPWNYKGVSAVMPTASVGHTRYAAGDPSTDGHYGEEHTNEWFGVPSARRL